jgi:hypothetical protein
VGRVAGQGVKHGPYARHSLQGTIVPNCGHFIAEEQPEWLAERLQQFIGWAS